MVSHAARVGAMTITRPVGGSALRNASGSGGDHMSRTCRITAAAGARMAPLGLSILRRETLYGRTLRAVAALPLFRDVVVAEDDASLRRPAANRACAVGRRWLLRGGHIVEPDAAHPR